MKLAPAKETKTSERIVIDLTPLEEMEAAVHEEFPAQPPTKEKIGEFLTERFPKMDGGISVGIAIAAFILQGWQAYSDHKNRRREKQRDTGGARRCPKCSEEDMERDRKAGKFVCKHGYKI